MHLKTSLLFWIFVLVLSACGDAPPDESPPSANQPPADVPAQVADPNATCPSYVQDALVATDGACEVTARNQACYGNVMVVLNPNGDTTGLKFSEPGDMINVADIDRLHLEPLDIQHQVWGVVLMRLQANLSDTTPGQNVTFLMFGDVEFENRSPSGTTNINSFYFTSGIGDAACTDAPESGLLIQTPEGVGTIDLSINAVDISIGSTAYLQAQPDANMTINVIEGQAEVTAEGETQTVIAGNRTTIGLDADGTADSPPTVPESYDVQPLRHLPVRNLPRPIEVTETTQLMDFTPIGFEVSDSIDSIGETDIFEFEAVAGQRIYIDALSAPTDSLWSLYFERPENADLTQENETRISTTTRLGHDLGYFELSETGTYQILVRESNETFGAYAFRVWDVPPPQQLNLSPVPDMPDELLGMGSGTIETPGVTHEYIVTVDAGQTIYFDGVESASSIRWNVFDSDNTQLISLTYSANRDLGSLTLDDAGTYTIRVWGEGDATGTYSFQLWDVPPVNTLDLTLPDDAHERVVGAGTGDIETPSVVDEYTLEVSAGQTIYFDGVESASSIRWNVFDSDNTQLISLTYSVNRDLGSLTFDDAGTYTIRVWGEGDATGTYSFQLWDVPPVNSLTLTTGTGSGDIETPGVIDEYALEVTAGQTIYFDGVESASGVRWNVFDSDDTRLISSTYSVNRDLENITFETAGTYIIRVWGEGDATGTYGFELREEE